MTAYYNEFDPYAAQWLRNLIAAGHIAAGDVDERSIVEVQADDIRGYTQVHLFAGIGVWSYGLRRAGWGDDRPVWTGSCPCPPFSSAGKQKACPGCGGFRPLPHASITGAFTCVSCGHVWIADERHLWPEFARLVFERRPDVVLGEQVASADGRLWVDTVCTEMEAMGYAAAAVDTCSAGHGAPHIRQRLRFAAYNSRLAADGVCHGAGVGRQQRLADANGGQPRETGAVQPGGEHGFKPEDGCLGGVAHTNHAGLQGWGMRRYSAGKRASGAPGVVGGVGAAFEQPRQRNARSVFGTEAPRDGKRIAVNGLEYIGPEHASSGVDTGRAHPTNGFWRDADWLYCRDDKWRPVEPGTFPLADGVANRVGKLRAYGNAVDAEATRGFIEAVMECLP